MSYLPPTLGWIDSSRVVFNDTSTWSAVLEMSFHLGDSKSHSQIVYRPRLSSSSHLLPTILFEPGKKSTSASIVSSRYRHSVYSSGILSPEVVPFLNELGKLRRNQPNEACCGFYSLQLVTVDILASSLTSWKSSWRTWSVHTLITC